MTKTIIIITPKSFGTEIRGAKTRIVKRPIKKSTSEPGIDKLRKAAIVSDKFTTTGSSFHILDATTEKTRSA